MSFILPILYVFVFGYFIYTSSFFRSTQLSITILMLLFASKLLSAFALHGIYTYYYPVRAEADVFKYFDDARVLFHAFKDSPINFFKIFFDIDNSNVSLDTYYNNMNFWSRKIDYGLFNDNRTIISCNVIVMFFSWGNVLVHHVVASFISLVSYVFIYKIFYSYFKGNKAILIITIFLIPSTLFWTSAMLKECIVMFGLGMFFYGLVQLNKNVISAKYIALVVFGLILLMLIKIYVIVALFPAVIAFSIAHKYNTIQTWKVYIAVFLSVCIGLVINEILDVVPFVETLANKRNDFIMDSVYYAHARSYITIGMLDDNLLAFVIETPQALLRVITLPIIWNITSPLEIIPAIENVGLILLVVMMIVWYKRPTYEQKNLIYFSIFFSFALIWLVGITTPVVGAIVRYKVPIFPFLYTTFALLIDWHKVLNFLQFRNGNSII